MRLGPVTLALRDHGNRSVGKEVMATGIWLLAGIG